MSKKKSGTKKRAAPPASSNDSSSTPGEASTSSWSEASTSSQPSASSSSPDPLADRLEQLRTSQAASRSAGGMSNGHHASPSPSRSSSSMSEQPQASTSGGPAFPSSAAFSFDIESAMTDAQKAARRKDAGNLAFKAKRYGEALDLYSQAMQLDPSNATYYSNTAAAQIELKRYAEARDTCLRVAELQASDPQAKTYARLGKCQLAVGDFATADISLARALELEPTNRSALTDMAALREVRSTLESIERERANGGHSFVLIGLDRLERLVARLPTSYKLWRVEALLAKRPNPDVDSALSIASELLRGDQRNADALFWRGRALWMAGSTEQAVTHWRQALTMAPDHAPAKLAWQRGKKVEAEKVEGNAAFKSGNYAKAIEHYDAALELAEDCDAPKAFFATLLSNRATTRMSQGKIDAALEDCNACLELDPGHVKALRTRAKALIKQEDFESAVRDLKAASQTDGLEPAMRSALKNELRQAEIDLKRSKTVNHYKVLGVEKDASDHEVKKAYRKASLIHHPDRGGDEAQFKQLSASYEVLSDSSKRARYDSGADDLDDPMAGFGGGHHHHPFASGFGGGFGGGGSGGPSGYGGAHFDFADLFGGQGGGMPQGFRSARSHR